MSLERRRFVETNAVELLEAALEATAELGWAHGNWQVTLHVQDGHVVRATGVRLDQRPPMVVARRQRLMQAGRVEA